MPASHVGHETTLTALGRSWRLARWSRAVWTEFLVWARTQIPDPVEVASRHLERFPARLQDVVVCHALEMSNQYLAISSPEVQRLLSDITGITYLLYLLLRQHQPLVTDQDAIDIALELGEVAVKEATERAGGKVEGEDPNVQARSV